VPVTTTDTHKVFFINLSGGMQLNGLGFTSEPILEVRGVVDLEIDAVRNVFKLEMSGTIKIIKIGNIASAAGRFILDNSHTTSNDPQFWGVLKFQVNLAILENYGVFLGGEATLQINVSNQDRVETLFLEGVPGDVMFTLTDTTLTANLPTGVLSSRPLPADWVTRFSDNGITLDNPTVTTIVDGSEWRVDSGTLQYFIVKEKNAGGTADVLDIKGENQTFHLPHESFAIEIAGGLRIQPAGMSQPLFNMDGGFFLTFSPDKFEVFAIARWSAS